MVMDEQTYVKLRKEVTDRILAKMDEIGSIIQEYREELGGDALDANTMSLYMNLDDGFKNVSVYRKREVDDTAMYIVYADVIHGEYYPDGINTVPFIMNKESE